MPYDLYGTYYEPMQRFIVAEINKNCGRQTPVDNLLCQQFEAVININAERGYKLIDWKLTSAQNDELFTETIIAIFELEQKEDTHEDY